MLKVYNSLTFKKEEFKTINPNEVLMYVCGPTVYDSPHLGHAKSAVAFDIIHRYLKFKGYKVKMVKNYTDIDDKIIKRANEKNIDFNELSEFYIKEYEDVMNLLNIQKDYMNPRATEVIDFMIEFIQNLISKGNAYESNGSVYFSIKTFPNYKIVLQNISGEDLEDEDDLEEHDLTYVDDKRDAKDFALWKKSKENEPYWESPWGRGRPGWHIECSAMAINILGETIDIHGGGQDLKFPHHRNEIAQSESHTGKPFANYFMHNGFVNVDNEKMSKSLDNFFLVTDVAKEYHPMVIRYFLISGQYRSSINYSLKNLNQAKKNYNKIINSIEKINEIEAKDIDSTKLISRIDEAENKLTEAMNDDFNTPVALAEVMSLIRELNKSILEEKVSMSEKFKDRFFAFIKNIDKIFGLFPTLRKDLSTLIPATFDERGILINNLLELITEIRKKLRVKRIYDISDDIRERLRDFWIRKELDLSIAGSFDARGKLIDKLIEILKKISIKLEERNIFDIREIIFNEVDTIGLGEGLTIDIAGDFDLRGELIEKILQIFVRARSDLRDKKLFDMSDFICELLGDFWTQKGLDLGLGGSFVERGELINEIIDVITDTRTVLRKRKIFHISDFIRDELRKLGMRIEDF